MKSCARALLLSLFIPLSAMGAREAILVGSSTGTATLASLKYVKNDLTALDTVLGEQRGFSA